VVSNIKKKTFFPSNLRDLVYETKVSNIDRYLQARIYARASEARAQGGKFSGAAY